MDFPQIIPASQYATVFFGQYFIPDGGKPLEMFVRHPIEWLVLKTDPQENRALLLSKYAIDWEGFADCPLLGHGYETSWHDSYLRTWLNNTFYQESFSAEEQAVILPMCDASCRDNDKIFLLSAEDVREYFPRKESAVALEPMFFAASRTGAADKPFEVSYYTTAWWTRTSGKTNDLVVCVDRSGELLEADSNCNELGVRPAMWIRL